ncbi:PH domain-containing protein [Thalassotalea sp. PS06]|uniref:PH domain-containing protein n=1 Tax=Thalassotalea sp. PS06 TaxID=2594005 RepID=UPI0011643144|nr:PH domain-containing protein [Thalassotalea sp. PS06]QDP02789.1 PH domain-containing protein [Thalassotalea sp. PS06]
MADEKDVWRGTPSQVINMGSYILLGLFFWLVIPLFIMLWKWLQVKNMKYELTTQRLRTHHGVFNKEIDELELYRIRDYRLDQPFFLRMFSKSNIEMATSDRTHPKVTIRAVDNGEEIREMLRTYVEECRTRKGVREFDVD